MDYECPKCKKKNKLILLGNDYGCFEQTCKGCLAKMEIEVDKEQNIDYINIKKTNNQLIDRINKVPSDYEEMEVGKSTLEKNQKKTEKNRLVKIISLLILSASLMGFLTGGALYYSPDEFPDSEVIKIEIIVRNKTTTIDNAEILINNKDTKQKHLGDGSYEFFLKPGRYQIQISAPNHMTANMEVYIPLQDNNLSLVNYNQGLDGVNLFTFNLKEGNGEEELDSNTYNRMIKWCPSLMLVFSLIGTWGAWMTYTLQSYKNAQIGAFFSIMAMGFFVIGPILGIIALILLPRVKKSFTVPFKN